MPVSLLHDQKVENAAAIAAPSVRCLDFSRRASLLAARAIKRRALSLPQRAHRRCTEAARLAFPAIHKILKLKIAGCAVAAEVAQGAAALVDRLTQHRDDLPRQVRIARAADAPGRGGRVDARAKQRLGGVDVAYADHDVTCEQERFYCRSAPARALIQGSAIELAVERLHPQPGKQGMPEYRPARGGVPQHRAKAARVHDWQLSRTICEMVGVPVFLAGGLRVENVADAVRTVRPFGIDVCSGVRRGGVLDRALLAEFMATARAVVL